MEIKSPNFENGGYIPRKYTCDGENINPQLLIINTPEKTQSLVLIVDDPDAPKGIFTHWIVWNIESTIKEIKENSVPRNAIVGLSSAGENRYTGPCPPSGTHRYFFKLFALNIKLNLLPNTDKQQLEEVMQNHIIEKTELIGLYTH